MTKPQLTTMSGQLVRTDDWDVLREHAKAIGIKNFKEYVTALMHSAAEKAREYFVAHPMEKTPEKTKKVRVKKLASDPAETKT